MSKLSPAALDAVLAGGIVRITEEINRLVAHDLITQGEGTVILSLLDQADTRRMMERKRDVLGDTPLADVSNLTIAEVECTLGIDLCFYCEAAAGAAAAHARATGAVEGTYRDERIDEDGTRIVHTGSWRREDWPQMGGLLDPEFNPNPEG